MTKVKVVLEVDIETLRQVRQSNIGEEDAKNESLEEAISQELGWVEQSGISVHSVQELDPDHEVIRRLQEIISGGDGEIEKAIIEYLRNTDEDLDQSAHGHEFKHEGKDYEIIMWEPCEHFTLQMVAEHIEI